jgi:phosphoketolase
MAKSRPAPSRPNSLPAGELHRIDAYWRACNYLAAGMIYLQDNPLLREPLKPAHIKNRLLGHWGASPGLSFTYVHMNRLINKYDLDAIFLAGPGHGAPGVLVGQALGGVIFGGIAWWLALRVIAKPGARRGPAPVTQAAAAAADG